MTLDERIQALTMHLEVLSGMHLDSERRQEEFQRQMTQYAAEVKDAIRRLTNIAEAHNSAIDDHENRIERLEDK